jgi:hypothetical protein
MWWREDDKWVRCPPRLEQRILVAGAAGAEKQQLELLVPLGQIAAAQNNPRPHVQHQLAYHVYQLAHGTDERELRLQPRRENSSAISKLQRTTAQDRQS